jgi:LysR family transcriptional regulator, transcriptional activator of the cysJI operon
MENVLRKKISLGDLYLFDLLAKYGSISSVAAHTGMTQPAVTQKLHRMETQLECKLWMRRGRLLGEPTEEGRRFLQYAHNVFKETADFFTDIGILTRQKVIRIAASTIPLEYFLPRMVTEYHECNDLIELHVTLSGSRKVCSLVENENVDVGFTGYIIPGYTGNSMVIAEDSIVPVVSPLSAIAESNRPVLLEELFAMPLVLREYDSGTRSVLEDNLEHKGIVFPQSKIRYVLGSASAVMRSIHEGAGFSFVSSYSTGDLYVPTIRDFPPIRRHFFLIYRKETMMDERIRQFVEFVRNYFRIS